MISASLGLQQSIESLNYDITARLQSAGEILGIRLLDRVIFNSKDYYSFLEKGLI